jgi:uncharacterized ion transporter superfamily protein YfcC
LLFKVGFEVLTAVSMKIAVFRAIALMMEAARTSETLVNFTRLHGATTQKTAIFILFFL